MPLMEHLRNWLGWDDPEDVIRWLRQQREHSDYLIENVRARLNSEEQWFFNNSLNGEEKSDCACNRPDK